MSSGNPAAASPGLGSQAHATALDCLKHAAVGQAAPLACMTSTPPPTPLNLPLPPACRCDYAIAVGMHQVRVGCQSRGTHSGGKTRTQAGGEEGTGKQSQDGQPFSYPGISRVFRAMRSRTETWNRCPQCPKGSNTNNTLISNFGSWNCERLHSCWLRPSSCGHLLLQHR